MKNAIAATLLATSLAIPAISTAQAPARTGFVLGARAAYGFPLGDVGDSGGDADDSFDTFVDNAFPLWLELNYRFGPSLELGVYGQYAFLNLGEDVGGESGRDIRAGLQLNYVFSPGASLTPWIGVGGGWEWLTGDTNLQFADLDNLDDTSISGWDLMVQGGLDFHSGDRLTFGPFAAATFGQFGDLELDGESTNIDDKAWHEWIQVGLRATFF